MQQQVIGHNPTAVGSPGQDTLRLNRGNSCVCGWTIQAPWYSGGGGDSMILCDFMSFVRGVEK